MWFAVDLPELRWLFEDFAYNIQFSSLLPASVGPKADTRRRRLCRVPLRPMGRLIKESVNTQVTENVEIELVPDINETYECIIENEDNTLPFAHCRHHLHARARAHTHTHIHIAYIHYLLGTVSIICGGLPADSAPAQDGVGEVDVSHPLAHTHTCA